MYLSPPPALSSLLPSATSFLNRPDTTPYSDFTMATRGVFQLQKLTLSYCEVGGSSKVIRDFLSSGNLLDWAKERPHIQIRVKVRNGNHPNIQADYLTNVDESIHQICVKSSKVSTPDIPAVLNQLYNRSGRKITKLTKPIYTDTPSVQGVWTPALNLHLQPEFKMEIKGGN